MRATRWANASSRRTLERDPQASDGAIDKDRNRFSHAPLVLVVVAKQGPDEKIPASERFSAASCVCFALLQAAQACGFGAQWLTGWPAYDPAIAQAVRPGRTTNTSPASSTSARRNSTRPSAIAPTRTTLLTDWSPA